MAGNKKPKHTKRRQLKSVTPITLGLSKERSELIKMPPRVSLGAFKADKGTATDWYNIAFRLNAGLALAELCYSDETVLPIKEAVQVTETIRERYHLSGETVWSALPEEFPVLAGAIDATDEMQDDTLRRDQLTAHKKAHSIMIKCVV